MTPVTTKVYEHRRALRWVRNPFPLCSHLRLGALLRSAVSMFTAAARRLAAARRCAARVVASQRKKSFMVWTGNRTQDLLIDKWYHGTYQVNLTNAGEKSQPDTKKAEL